MERAVRRRIEEESGRSEEEEDKAEEARKEGLEVER